MVEPIVTGDQTRFASLTELIDQGCLRTPDAPAISDPHQTLTYRQLHTALTETATWLASAGVRAGDRVLLVGENTCGLVVLLLAAQHMQAWPAIANARLPLAEIEALGRHAGVRLTVFPTRGSRAAAERAREASAAPRHDLTIGEVALGALAGDVRPEPLGADPARNCALLLFTSGTTGRPKAVMSSANGIGGLGQSLARARGVKPDDTVMGAAPLSHIMGIAVLAYTLAGGAHLKLVPRLETADLAERLASGQMTQLSLVPTAYSRLLDYIATHKVDLSRHCLGYASSGGAPLDPTLKAAIEATFGVPLVNAYGLTECAPICRSPPRWNIPADCIGYPEPGVEVAVRLSDGRHAGPGDIGELVARTPWTMMGYYNDAAATAAVLSADGWFATGDLARLGDDGAISLVGRIKELIIRSGFNIYPAEVEAVINEHPDIVQSAVIGTPTQDGNEEVVAFVQAAADRTVSVEELERQVRARLAPYKCPGRWLVVDQLPIGPTGKILKRELAARLSVA